MVVFEHACGECFFIWFGYARSSWCWLYGKCRFRGLVIDEGVCNMLDVSCSVQKCDGENVPRLVIQLR